MSLLQIEIGMFMLIAFLAGMLGVWAVTGNKKSS